MVGRDGMKGVGDGKMQRARNIRKGIGGVNATHVACHVAVRCGETQEAHRRRGALDGAVADRYCWRTMQSRDEFVEVLGLRHHLVLHGDGPR